MSRLNQWFKSGKYEIRFLKLEGMPAMDQLRYSYEIKKDGKVATVSWDRDQYSPGKSAETVFGPPSEDDVLEQDIVFIEDYLKFAGHSEEEIAGWLNLEGWEAKGGKLVEIGAP
jgi:hypothetical protein